MILQNNFTMPPGRSNNIYIYIYIYRFMKEGSDMLIIYHVIIK